MKNLIILFAMLSFVSCKKGSEPQPQSLNHLIKFEVKAAKDICYININGKPNIRYTSGWGQWATKTVFDSTIIMNVGETYSLHSKIHFNAKEPDYQMNVYQDGILINNLKVAFDVYDSNTNNWSHDWSLSPYGDWTLTGTIK